MKPHLFITSLATICIALVPSYSSLKAAPEAKKMLKIAPLSHRVTPAEKAVNATIRRRIAADIRAKATPMRSLDGDSLLPILAAVDGKKLVGLGEPTHGTSEATRLRGNLILAMAKKGRVRVFIEDQYLAVAPISEWIGGAGTDTELKDRLSYLSFTVNKKTEFVDFLRAARNWNATAGADHKIEIHGIDVSIVGPGPYNPAKKLGDFLTANGVAMAADLAAVNDCLENLWKENPTPARMVHMRSAAVKLAFAVSGTPATAPGRAEASVLANTLVRFGDLQTMENGVFSGEALSVLGGGPSIIPGNGIRDAGMAENIRILMDGMGLPGDQSVYWSHNGHIARMSPLDGDGEVVGFPSAWGTTGSILNMWLGEDYVPIGILAGVGTASLMVVNEQGKIVDAQGKEAFVFQAVQLPAPPVDSINVIATSVNRNPLFFLTGQISFMRFVHPETLISLGYEPAHPEYTVVHNAPGLAYHAIVSLPTSTASHPVPN